MKKTVKKLIAKYDTNNPREIAKAMGIEIIFEPLGEINGYYQTGYRQKLMHINCDLPKHIQNLVIAHELGHAILHKNTNTPYLRANTFFRVGRLEIEADKFAVELLISDDELREYRECYGYTTQQLAMIYGYPEELIELRLK
ncbi:ImmA/IrrE family metallo-endopeptidase [Turicibacter sanguinis]|uniref:ImmA/IrrE family metallo-endopeptidase n=1 Tax=Turicibacter sanguinis TaxID=154288 RepID=UPI0012BC8185|nr:ImmA/IrrE family metallo-endopeptidase [Turicibacter sanguinis]MCU7195507.1 ImmA/IrrE family metallo-endopeptidase [Turicibacter sanguinis]MTP79279.1 ImmA/IrrE family metallo-endopeptidase [Turicibacter sanguinis]